MTKRLLWTLLAALISLPASADEMLVFKKDSSFKGAAMRVASYQRKEGRLLIRGVRGEVFSAAEAAVDWDMSKKATESLRETEQAEASQRVDDQRARQASEARSEAKPIGLVEASRRYGVDKPAVSVASGSASREPAPVATEAAAPASGAPAAAASSGDVKAARDRLAAAKAEHERVSKEVDILRADNNPDPVSAAYRESRLRDRQAQLADLQKKVLAAEAAVAKAEAPPPAAKAPAKAPEAKPTPARTK